MSFCYSILALVLVYPTNAYLPWNNGVKWCQIKIGLTKYIDSHTDVAEMHIATNKIDNQKRTHNTLNLKFGKIQFE